MTDKWIIKVLENCISANCSICPYHTEDGCTDALMQDAISLINRQKVEIERLQGYINGQNCLVFKSDAQELLNDAKSEAIKEFAEKLKEVAYPLNFVFYSEIDNLVKETVGENK